MVNKIIAVIITIFFIALLIYSAFNITKADTGDSIGVDINNTALVQENKVHTVATAEIEKETPYSDIQEAEIIEAEEIPEYIPDYNDAVTIAKVMYNECKDVPSMTERSAVAWCILNRLDSDDPYFPESIYEICTQPYQFAYDANNPIDEECLSLAQDVMTRWYYERETGTETGRTLPREYLFFTGDGYHNYFTTEWQSGITYDWNGGTPYED